MEQKYSIKNGEIIFDENKIVIIDSAKKEIRTKILLSSIWTIYGILSVFRGLKTDDQFVLWSGLFIGIAHLVILIFTIFRTGKNTIENKDIKKIVLKNRFGNSFLDIKLKNNKTRRVNLLDEIPDELKNLVSILNSIQ